MQLLERRRQRGLFEQQAGEAFALGWREQFALALQLPDHRFLLLVLQLRDARALGVDARRIGRRGENFADHAVAVRADLVRAGCELREERRFRRVPVAQLGVAQLQIARQAGEGVWWRDDARRFAGGDAAIGDGGEHAEVDEQREGERDAQGAGVHSAVSLK